MKIIWCIFKKEFLHFFTAPATYVILAVFLGISGFFFYNIASFFALQCSQAADYQLVYNVPLPPMSVNLWVIRPFFSSLVTLVIFLIPIVTMHNYAAEKSNGTAELLMTSPISTSQIVWAKFFSSLIIYSILIAATISFHIIIACYSSAGIDWAPVMTGYAGLFMLGLATIPIGQFISSMTNNQIIAAFLSFAFLLLLWIIDWSTLFAEGMVSDIIGYIGISNHFENFAKGIIDISDIVYFISLGAIGIFLTHQSVESWRWRGTN